MTAFTAVLADRYRRAGRAVASALCCGKYDAPAVVAVLSAVLTFI